MEEDMEKTLTATVVEIDGEHHLVIWNGLFESLIHRQIVFNATYRHSNFWKAVSGLAKEIRGWKKSHREIQIHGFDDSSSCWPVPITFSVEDILETIGDSSIQKEDRNIFRVSRDAVLRSGSTPCW